LSEPPVVDASPLIHLSRTGNIDLLKSLGPTIVVPASVYDEVRAKTSDESARVIQETPWLHRVPKTSIPADIVRWSLGAGESAVLAWASSHPGCTAILDDGKGRKLAQELGLPLIGTLGVVLRAKRRGLIPHARPVVERMIANGMYLSPSVVQKALALVGE
jgi:predicted nucleic acid-binding protein